MNAVILQIAFAPPDVVELLPPVHLEARSFLRQNHPAQSDSHACQRLGIGGVAFGILSMSEVDELRKLQPVFPGCKPE